jgi:hypothetical protein
MNARRFMIVNIRSRYNKIRDQRYYDIEMLDDETGSFVRTYTCPDYSNWSKWEKIVDAWEPDTMISITGKFKFKRDKTSGELTNIVNADSMPFIEEIYNETSREIYLNSYAQAYL